jgi:hypothetical protein
VCVCVFLIPLYKPVLSSVYLDSMVLVDGRGIICANRFLLFNIVVFIYS